MFENKKILILGLARSGYQAAKLLIKRNNDIYLNEFKTEDKLDKDQIKELGFSDAWKKELTDKINEFEPIATKELKDASENINKYLFNLVKAVFEYHKVVIEMPSDEALKNMSKKVRGLVAAGGGQLQPDFIFNAVKVLYID